MKQVFIIFTVLIFLSGCTIKRTIYTPIPGADLSLLRSMEKVDAKELVRLGMYEMIIVDALKEDLITFDIKGVKGSIDGRGRPGMIEQALGIMFMSLPEVTINAD